MATKRRVRGNPIPLILEDHPADYKGYPFITLIQYRDQHVLMIVDNANDKTIDGFVLDLCGPANVNEELVISTAAAWFEQFRDRFPVSFYFSQQGLSESFSRIYRTYPVEFITRIIGPKASFDISEGISIKRRRRKPVPRGMRVVRIPTLVRQ